MHIEFQKPNTRYWSRTLKDPLLHFLALGFVLFALYGWVNPADDIADNPKHILVDRDKLLTFIQYRAKTFQPQFAEAKLKAMNAAELRQLVRDYVREETLHREARTLGLGDGDYIIKRRMIQKIEFIAQTFAEATARVSVDELKAYYEANKARYLEPANITFTHVFFDGQRRSMREAEVLAKAKLTELHSSQARFSDAPGHGEPFPYGVNFVERTRDHVESQFGKATTHDLFAMEPKNGVWAGPFRSPHGVHLVMVAKRVDDSYPAFKAVAQRVKADLESNRQQKQAEKAIQAIMDSYTVEVTVRDSTGKLPNIARNDF